jgi:hypothetical protein
MRYSLSPERNSVRVMVTSLKSMGNSCAELSMVSATSARPSADRLVVPAKMTSSIFWDRTDEGAWAPSTHEMASTTLDLPEPLGPTTTVTPGSNRSVAVSANDLKPLMVSDLRNNQSPLTNRCFGQTRGRLDSQRAGNPARGQRAVTEPLRSLRP